MELKDVIAQAESAEQLMLEISTKEEVLKDLKDRLRKLIEETIPNIFIENGMTAIDLTSGAHVGLKQIFAVSMPAAGTIVKAKPDQKKKLIKRLNGCVSWLRKHKGADIIKSSIAVEFSAGVGNEKIAKELFAELRTRKLHPISSKTVHPGTLKSFLREKWNADVEIPVELFELYTGQTAEFSLPKPDKKPAKRSAKS